MPGSAVKVVVSEVVFFFFLKSPRPQEELRSIMLLKHGVEGLGIEFGTGS